MKNTNRNTRKEKKKKKKKKAFSYNELVNTLLYLYIFHVSAFTFSAQTLISSKKKFNLSSSLHWKMYILSGKMFTHPLELWSSGQATS